MKTLLRSDLKLSTSRLRRGADRRSWLANTIINSLALQSSAGDQRRHRQAVRPPVFVHIFRRARREEGTVADRLRAALLCAACLVGIWFSQAGAQARCGGGKPASGQCVENFAAGARDLEVPRRQDSEGNTIQPPKRSDHE